MGILLLFILVTRCSQFDLYLLSFWSTGFTFNSSKISSFLLWSNSVYSAVLLKIFFSNDVNRFFILLSEGRNYYSIIIIIIIIIY